MNIYSVVKLLKKFNELSVIDLKKHDIIEIFWRVSFNIGKPER